MYTIKNIMKPILFFIICFFILFNTQVKGEDKSMDIKGSLVIVGGRLESNNQDIYNKFIELAMKYRNKRIEEIKIGIVPAGSLSPLKSAGFFKEDLIKYKVCPDNIIIIPVAVKDDKESKEDESKWKDNGNNPDVAHMVDDLDAIWFVGGDQERYIKVLFKDNKETLLLKAIWELYKKGAVLGGSSAGAAIMSDPMIGGGESLASLNYGSVKDVAEKNDKRVIITKGLGFLKYAMVDQHFSQRGRLGRLIVAAMDTKNNMAFGIDENTALVLENMTVEAIGENGVTVVNLGEVEKNNNKTRMDIRNVLISYLEKGDKYNLKTGEYIQTKRDVMEDNDEEIPLFVTSIFDRVKDAISKLSFSEEITGTAFELKNDKEGEGFIVKFRKDKDSRISRGEIKGDESIGVMNVHMDIIPIKITITEE